MGIRELETVALETLQEQVKDIAARLNDNYIDLEVALRCKNNGERDRAMDGLRSNIKTLSNKA